MATRREMLEELVRRARSDPSFFHQLVFKPEEVLGKLDFLDRREKGMILALAPEDVIAGLAGLIVNPGGGVAECTVSCNNSCTNTCDSSCGDTCHSSCQDTCGSGSCGKTSNLGFVGEGVINEARTAFGGGRWFFRPVQRPAAR
jgi:hypothetical protein